MYYYKIGEHTIKSLWIFFTELQKIHSEFKYIKQNLTETVITYVFLFFIKGVCPVFSIIKKSTIKSNNNNYFNTPTKQNLQPETIPEVWIVLTGFVFALKVVYTQRMKFLNKAYF